MEKRSVEPPSVAEQVCQACGLCCNGVIFADVQLQPEDNADRLRELGLPLKAIRGKPGMAKFNQPCAAFQCNKCSIYRDRPRYCREFDCALLKSVIAGHNDAPSALRIIGKARRQSERVLKLLRALGDTDEQLALSKRFRRVQKRMETSPRDEETADTFGELTMAMHELNFLLSEAFYPGR